MTVQFGAGRADAAQIAAHLRACDGVFVPSLSGRVDIEEYGRKIADRAQCFEAWAGGELVGLIAAYCNSPDRQAAFITSVSVMPAWQGRGIASRLLEHCIAHVRGLGFARIELEVDCGNEAAIAVYKKQGFASVGKQGAMVKMALDLGKGTR